MLSQKSGRSEKRYKMCFPAWEWRNCLLLAGMVLTLLCGLNHSVQAAGFNPTGSMASTRQFHTATLLASNNVLVAGGYFGSTTVSGAEIYNPATGAFAATGSMAAARRLHTATRLSNGKVLIVGGINSSVLSSAELYDPTAGTFSATGDLATSARQLHTATLLLDGKVLIIGGRSGTLSSTTLTTAEIYDPETGLFTKTTGNLNLARANHSATLLTDGRVLVTGGIISGSAVTATAEIFDPLTGLFTATATPMAAARTFHAAVKLIDGTVLVTGGASNSDGTSLSSAEIFNPAGGGSFASAGTMNATHSKHTATLLNDGSVLIAGSSDYPPASISAVAELYLPGEGFPYVWDMSSPRASHTATLLVNGLVLLAGGSSSTTTVTASAERFNTSSIVVSPNVYQFPDTFITVTSAPKVFNIYNDSSTDLQIYSIALSGQNSALFAKSGNCATILPRTSCAVNVTFTPDTTGLKSASLDIVSDDPQLPNFSVPLSGIGKVGTSPQTITVTLNAPEFADFASTFTVAATASSGLPVSYSSGSPDVCTNVGPLFTMLSDFDRCTVLYNQAGNVTFAAAAQVREYTYGNPAPDQTLTITIGGDGSGTVNSSPDGIACSKGDATGCTASFPYGETVVLSATADWKSLFSNWSVSCSGNGSCTVILTASTGVTAIFAGNNQVKLANATTTHASLLDAYTAAADNETFLMQAYVFQENFTLNGPLNVKLIGGQDANYVNTIGVTTIQGSLTIEQGSAEISAVEIR
jgi:hypothetical protein